MREGSYLRPQVERLGLQHNVGRGRIWRIVAEDRAPRPAPRLLAASRAELVAALAHENGFWRDTAQKLLVLREDREAASEVRALLDAGAAPLARVHALWTLEGLDALTPKDVARALEDPDPRVRYSGVRASEAFLAAGDRAVLAAVAARATDSAVQVAAQVALSLAFAAPELATEAREAMLACLAHREGHEVVARAVRDALRGPDADEDVGGSLEPGALALAREGRAHYRQLCVACHGEDGRGTVAAGVALAPPLAGSARVRGSEEALVRIVVHGLRGPVDGRVWGAGVMAGLGAQDDRYLAAVLTYVRAVFGGGSGAIDPETVAEVRAACADRVEPWTLAELEPFAAIPAGVVSDWRASASHGGASAARALDDDRGTRFTTETPMRPGMWWRVDLDGEYELTRVVLDTRGSEHDYPRGCVLEGSRDGEAWCELARAAEDGGAVTVLRFPPVRVRAVRVVQTGTSERWWWSIHAASFCGRRL